MLALACVLGLLCGSFLNVVIYRLPHMLMSAEASPRFNLAWPPSHCPHCQHRLAAIDLIPIWSFLAQKGRCRYCHSPISRRYPLIEFFTMLCWGGSYWLTATPITAVMTALFLSLLLALTTIDIQHLLLPDVLTFSLLWLGLLWTVLGPEQRLSTQEAVLAAALAYLLLWLVAQGYWLWRGEIGLGLGDAKLFAAIAAWIGLENLPLVLLSASSLAALYGLLWRQRQQTPYIPFAPALAFSGAAIYLWQIVSSQ